MNKLKIIPGSMKHVDFTLAHSRPEDFAEFQGYYGNAYDALTNSLAGSRFAFTVVSDAGIAAMFGFKSNTLLGGWGLPWCITTTLINPHWREYARRSRWVTEQILGEFDALQITVDEVYLRANRWAKWLGFEYVDSIQFEENQAVFNVYTMERH